MSNTTNPAETTAADQSDPAAASTADLAAVDVAPSETGHPRRAAATDPESLEREGEIAADYLEELL
ncbi:MAG TPA: hypothetical protein VFR88_07810, partial [Microlunatus sp.]|nr:hypothetical protein [Microlunatus sp.]